METSRRTSHESAAEASQPLSTASTVQPAAFLESGEPVVVPETVRFMKGARPHVLCKDDVVDETHQQVSAYQLATVPFESSYAAKVAPVTAGALSVVTADLMAKQGSLIHVRGLRSSLFTDLGHEFVVHWADDWDCAYTPIFSQEYCVHWSPEGYFATVNGKKCYMYPSGRAPIIAGQQFLTARYVYGVYNNTDAYIAASESYNAIVNHPRNTSHVCISDSAYLNEFDDIELAAAELHKKNKGNALATGLCVFGDIHSMETRLDFVSAFFTTEYLATVRAETSEDVLAVLLLIRLSIAAGLPICVTRRSANIALIGWLMRNGAFIVDPTYAAQHHTRHYLSITAHSGDAEATTGCRDVVYVPAPLADQLCTRQIPTTGAEFAANSAASVVPGSLTSTAVPNMPVLRLPVKFNTQYVAFAPHGGLIGFSRSAGVPTAERASLRGTECVAMAGAVVPDERTLAHLLMRASALIA